MNLLLYREIGSIQSDLPDFGPAFQAHMAGKRNQKVYQSSLTAWNLLAEGLKLLSLPLPKVYFKENGKPAFADFGLHKTDFSLFGTNYGLFLTDFSLKCGKNTSSTSDFRLFFSLSHSQAYASALISAAPCGVDVECVRVDISDKLYHRCMHPSEIAAGLDFFSAWTRKECIAKLDGSGMPAKPSRLDSTDNRYHNWFTQRITDASRREYVLTALCQNHEPIHLINPDTHNDAEIL